MSKPKNDELAFPNEYTEGMSLRDYFAAQTTHAAYELVVLAGLNPHSDTIARSAYDIADAMLAERSKGGSK